MKTEKPTENDLAATLGPALKIWYGLIDSIVETFGEVDQEWKPSKLQFGRTCLLKQKKRTLIYMIPENEAVRVAIVLGERAVVLALSSDLPKEIKTLITEARPYVEGRGIRFAVTSKSDIDVVRDLIRIKITPK